MSRLQRRCQRLAPHHLRAVSSVGRAPRLQRGGREFESPTVHKWRGVKIRSDPPKKYMLADTLKKFAYPESLIKEYGHWLLLCRYKQATLGSLILICKEDATAFSHISRECFIELNDIIKQIEPALKTLFNYEKLTI